MKHTTLITCPMCNHEYSSEESAKHCGHCALFPGGGCHKVCCPRCGYEMPAPARLPRLIAQVMGKLTGKKDGG